MNIFKRIFSFFIKKKFLSFIILIAVLAGGYYWHKSSSNANGQISYVFAAVEKGTIISAVSGTGQVSALDEENVTPKTSGDLIYVGVQNGQNVTAGQVIARIDPTNAQKAVDAAQINLDQAKSDLKNMQGFKTDVGEMRGIKQKAQDNLNKAYEDGYNTVTSAFVSLPNIMVSFYGVLFDYSISKNFQFQNIDYYANYAGDTGSQYRQKAYDSYQTAKTDFDGSFDVYKSTNRSSGPAEINSLINGTYSILKDIADAIKNSMNLIQLYQNEMSSKNMSYNSMADTHLSALNGYTSTLNNYISSLLSVKTTIENNTETLIQTDYNLSNQEITVQDKQTALDDAKKTLSYCWITSPFDGVVSAVSVERGDTVSTNTTIATVVTRQQIAEISLNEVDAAKIALGQKVTISFDAISGLTITGQVAEIDTLGIVSQGVVSYSAKISFDTQDDRIKPGMSVSASIQTAVKQDVLLVPNSAVKKQGDSNYAQILVGNLAQKVSVQVGLSDDSNTEIISGLQEGQEIISQTISSASTSAGSNALGVPGVGGGGNVMFRGN